MRIDCQTCPARQIACDDCMMQVLFDPVNSGDVTGEPTMAIVTSGPVDDRELHAAIDIFCAESMATTSDAESARNAIAARQDSAGGRHLRILRAG